MLNNRRNRNKMDPTRINNYNKFLSTLDQKPTLNGDEKNVIKILSEKFTNSKVVNDKIVNDKIVNDKIVNNKDNIDKFIDKINTNFNITNISSSKFTGQTPNDICCINNFDPNYYRDIKNDKLIYLLNENKNPFSSKSKTSV